MDTIKILSDHAVELRYEQIPLKTVNHIKALIADTIGCILSGSSEDGVKETVKLLDFYGGAAQASIFAYGKKTSAPFAALANSIMAHANDYDDTHDAAVNHSCVTILPALLAVVESFEGIRKNGLAGVLCGNELSGKDIITAVCAGLETGNRLGMAFIPYLHTGWLPTTLWGPFASAAACGRILGLDKAQMQQAFGFAYSLIHANRQALADGTLAKRIQPGFSSMAGVQAVLFATSGLTAASGVIDGIFGIPALYTNGKLDKAHLLNGYGQHFETDSISLKPYPSCRCTHPVIDAALEIQEIYKIKWKDIDSGEIFLPPMSIGQIGRKFSLREKPVVDAQFSAQYTAALAFIRGVPKLSHFREDIIRKDITVIRLAEKFTVHEFEKGKPGLVPIEMKIRTKDGQIITERIEQAKGSTENPMTESERFSKFSDCLDNCRRHYDNEEKIRLFNELNNIDLMDNASDIISHLR